MRFSWVRFLGCAALVAGLASCSDDAERCDDAADNDDNALVDCADPACPAGTACGPNGLVCGASQACACSGGGAPEDRETSCGDFRDNDCDGLADCDDADCSGASCTTSPGPTSSLGSIRVASIQHSVMGPRHSGFQEQNELVFEVLDAGGRPYPAGLTVQFTHVSQGGSYVGLAPVCGTGLFPTCTAKATTNAQGRASVLLVSGNRFAMLSVAAQATAGGVDVSALADDVAVVGATPNGAHIGLDCRPWNVPALAEHDCMVSNYQGPGSTVDCVLTTADRYGIAIGVPTLAAFWSEAGAAGDPVLTVPYVAGASAAELEDMGKAAGYVSVRGQPLPWDVDPFGDEHRLQGVDFGCEARDANPRDGLVTVIALVAGEEGFVDTNGNGLYDPPDEPFVDVGEPFVDADDDGFRDPGEPFQDVDGNGEWTPPNGTWDAETVLWTQTRIVYTGQPAFRASAGLEYSRLYDGGTAPPPLAPPIPTQPPSGFTGDTTYDVYLADENFNPLSALAEYGALTVFGNAGAKLPIAPDGGAEDLGARFRLLYCDRFDANCVYGPASTACTTPGCHVVPDVSGFTYGTRFRLAVDCVRTGPDEALVTVLLNGVVHALSVSGTCP